MKGLATAAKRRRETSGRVSRYGVMPLDFSLDHMGPLTRSSRDAGLVMNAIAGHDGRDDTSSRQPVGDFTAGVASLKGKRIGVPENYYNELLDKLDKLRFRDFLRDVYQQPYPAS